MPDSNPPIADVIQVLWKMDHGSLVFGNIFCNSADEIISVIDALEKMDRAGQLPEPLKIPYQDLAKSLHNDLQLMRIVERY